MALSQETEVDAQEFQFLPPVQQAAYDGCR